MEIHFYEILISMLNSASWVQVLQLISEGQKTSSKFSLYLLIVLISLGHQNNKVCEDFVFNQRFMKAATV